MRLPELINKINNCVDNLEFVDARRLIELNLSNLTTPDTRKKLKRNAHELLIFIINENSRGMTSLTRSDYLVINSINKASTSFNISELKMLLKDRFEFLQREDVRQNLNSDAKTLLSSMGLILGM